MITVELESVPSNEVDCGVRIIEDGADEEEDEAAQDTSESSTEYSKDESPLSSVYKSDDALEEDKDEREEMREQVPLEDNHIDVHDRQLQMGTSETNRGDDSLYTPTCLSDNKKCKSEDTGQVTTCKFSFHFHSLHATLSNKVIPLFWCHSIFVY